MATSKDSPFRSIRLLALKNINSATAIRLLEDLIITLV